MSIIKNALSYLLQQFIPTEDELCAAKLIDMIDHNFPLFDISYHDNFLQYDANDLNKQYTGKTYFVRLKNNPDYKLQITKKFVVSCGNDHIFDETLVYEKNAKKVFNYIESCYEFQLSQNQKMNATSRLNQLGAVIRSAYKDTLPVE